VRKSACGKTLRVRKILWYLGGTVEAPTSEANMILRYLLFVALARGFRVSEDITVLLLQDRPIVFHPRSIVRNYLMGEVILHDPRHQIPSPLLIINSTYRYVYPVRK
jgi:hypothetical protein